MSLWNKAVVVFLMIQIMLLSFFLYQSVKNASYLQGREDLYQAMAAKGLDD